MCLSSFFILETNNDENKSLTFAFNIPKNSTFWSKVSAKSTTKSNTSLLTLKFSIGFGPLALADEVEPDVDPVDGGADGAGGAGADGGADGGADPVDDDGGGGGGGADPLDPLVEDVALLKKLL